MSQKTYTGINIQWPISELILSGKKTIETRTYPIPRKYLNKEMILIETPGKQGKFKSRMRAIVKFTSCFKYKSERVFYEDTDRHYVDPKSPWAYDPKKGKWGWCLEIIRLLPSIEVREKKGIIYTKELTI